jgi:voltage-gated potassium channel
MQARRRLAGGGGGYRRRVPVLLPTPVQRPLRAIGVRVVIAVGLLFFVALATYLGRDGYRDSAGGEIGLLDAAYYATVSVTTTGYGDIVPVTDDARLITTVFVTPARVLFLIILVGTTLELLAERYRATYRQRRWRSSVRDHVIVCGYGVKGRAAIDQLRGQGARRGDVVVIDPDPAAVARANADGYAGILGDASHSGTLREAGIDDARAVVVAPSRDDAAVLITLTVRELAPRVFIAAAAREAENAHLLRQGGADSVISSSDAAGRLLGLATHSPRVVNVLEDLLTAGEGLDIIERPIERGEVDAPSVPVNRGELLVAVVRGGELIRFDDPRAGQLRPGDRLVCLAGRPTPGKAEDPDGATAR